GLGAGPVPPQGAAHLTLPHALEEKTHALPGQQDPVPAVERGAVPTGVRRPRVGLRVAVGIHRNRRHLTGWPGPIGPSRPARSGGHLARSVPDRSNRGLLHPSRGRRPTRSPSESTGPPGAPPGGGGPSRLGRPAPRSPPRWRARGG